MYPWVLYSSYTWVHPAHPGYTLSLPAGMVNVPVDVFSAVLVPWALFFGFSLGDAPLAGLSGTSCYIPTVVSA